MEERIIHETEVLKRFDEDITVVEEYLTLRLNSYIRDVLREKTCKVDDLEERDGKYLGLFNVVNLTNSSMGFQNIYGPFSPFNSPYSLNVFIKILKEGMESDLIPAKNILDVYLNSTYKVVRK